MRSAAPQWLQRALAAAAAVALVASFARAQGTGRSLDLDVSIRAAGMGEASNAVCWGEGLNQWANPALLGYHRGIRWEWGKTQLVPGLANDVSFETNVLKLGGGGLGVSLAGKPIDGLGSLKLDYGRSQATDDQGNPIGTFDSHEDISSLGFGLSLAQGIETVAKLAGHEPPTISRMLDVSLGMNSKKIDMDLGPGLTGGTTALDRGLLVRISPLEWIPPARDVPLGLDLAYGWSELSYDDASIDFGPLEGVAPLSRHHRHGGAGRLAFEIPAELRDSWRDRGGGWLLLLGLDPLLSLSYADDRDRIEPSNGQFKTHGTGYEITVANVFSYRIGHFEDPLGDIDGDTKGWGAELPLGHVAGVRYDHATIPQAADSGLPDVTREAWAGWIDPLELWSLWRGRGSRWAAR